MLFYFNIKAQLENFMHINKILFAFIYRLIILDCIKIYIYSSLLGLIILAPMRAKLCNSKGDTCQTGK